MFRNLSSIFEIKNKGLYNLYYYYYYYYKNINLSPIDIIKNICKEVAKINDDTYE